MKVKIEKTSTSNLWYKDHIGKEVEIIREDKDYYWVNELDGHPFLNIVHKEDASPVFKSTLIKVVSNLFC